MTTVEFSISSAKDRGISLHDGGWGPASDLMHETLQLVWNGTIDRTGSSSAQVDSRADGTRVRLILDRVDLTREGWRGTSAADEISAFISRIDDNTEYHLYGLEV